MAKFLKKCGRIYVSIKICRKKTWENFRRPLWMVPSGDIMFALLAKQYLGCHFLLNNELKTFMKSHWKIYSSTVFVSDKYFFNFDSSSSSNVKYSKASRYTASSCEFLNRVQKNLCSENRMLHSFLMILPLPC